MYPPQVEHVIAFVFTCSVTITFAWCAWRMMLTRQQDFTEQERLIDESFRGDLQDFKDQITNAKSFGFLTSLKTDIDKYILQHKVNHKVSDVSMQRIRELYKYYYDVKYRITPSINIVHR